MRKGAKTSLQIAADIGEFDTAQTFVGDLLKRASISREIARETLVLFETVFTTVLMQDIDHSTVLNISAEDRLGGFYLKIGYEGKRFTPPEEIGDGMSFELQLLEGYADKVSHSYRSGYNTIRISVQKRPRANLVRCGVGMLVAIVAYTIISALAGFEEQQVLLEDYVFPLEQLYAHAMLMVGAPATFFSLLKNSTDAVVVSERTFNAQKIHVKAIATSVFATVLALGLSFALAIALSGWSGYDPALAGGHLELTFSELVVSMMPASIFEPFETLSPIPLIVVAMLVTYAFISAGRDFDVLKRAIDVCYGLFSRMLSAVTVALPVFCFLAILDVMLRGGFGTLAYILVFIAFAIASTCVLFATYAIRLKAKGVKIGPFVKKLLPLLRENIAIGSTIDAVPYNIRYCVKHYGMDRRRVSRIHSLLAQINRDGNCFLLTFVSTLYIYATGMEVSAVNIAVIAAIALFLSFGAPNQPGSILIGMIIIISYLNSFDMVCIAIYLEVFLSGMQNMINVIGDIVMVVEEEGARE